MYILIEQDTRTIVHNDVSLTISCFPTGVLAIWNGKLDISIEKTYKKPHCFISYPPNNGFVRDSVNYLRVLTFQSTCYSLFVDKNKT